MKREITEAELKTMFCQAGMEKLPDMAANRLVEHLLSDRKKREEAGSFLERWLGRTTIMVVTASNLLLLSRLKVFDNQPVLAATSLAVVVGVAGAIYLSLRFQKRSDLYAKSLAEPSGSM